MRRNDKRFDWPITRLVLTCLFSINALPGIVAAAPRLRDVCHVKGQEENTLHGLGLVVGLAGTGDGAATPTTQVLANMLRLMGNPLSQGDPTRDALAELKDAKNVALVFVTATVPAAGARQGSTIACEISAISAKSLVGGRLMLTPLLGPNPKSETIYAFAQGAIDVARKKEPTTGVVHAGCRFEADFVNNNFVKDNKITLIIDENHASFGMAQNIADVINMSGRFDSSSNFIAKALDQMNIEVEIPNQIYQEDPVLFLSDMLNQRISIIDPKRRVVVNEKTGIVVIGADVEIGPVAITHRNISLETGVNFVALDLEKEETLSEGDADRPNRTDADPPRGNTKLQALVSALNAIKVPSSDIIEIIREIDRSGQLYGKVVLQ